MTQIESGIIDAGCAQMAASPVCVCVRVCYRLRDARVSELLPPCRTLASVTPLPQGGKNSLGTKSQHKEKQTKKKTSHRLYNYNLYTRKVTQHLGFIMSHSGEIDDRKPSRAPDSQSACLEI